MTQMTQMWCNNATNAPFTGNLIPHSWYKAFTTESGRPDTTLISILSEIFYWYRPSRAGGSKFLSDVWQTSYDHFTTKFGYSRETVRRVFVKLEELGVAYRELRVIKSYGQRYNNVLFVHLVHEKLSSLTEAKRPINKLPNNPTNKLTNNPADKNFYVTSHKSYTPSPQIVGDHIEGDINLESIIRSDLGASDFANSGFLKLIHQPDTIEVNQETEREVNKKQFDPEINQTIEAKPQSNPYSSLISQSPLSPQSSSNPLNDQNQLNQSSHTHLSFHAPEGSKSQPSTTQPTINLRKPLSAFHPLTEEDAQYLRQSSGRPFNLSFINKLILKLSTQYPEHGFYKKSQLLSYLSLSLEREKYDSSLVNDETFYFRPKEGTAEYTQRQKHKYLKAIEESNQIDPITQIKRRIIGLSAGDEEYAYHLLTNFNLPYIAHNYGSKSDRGIINEPNNGKISFGKTNENLNQSKPLTNCIIKISIDITQDQKEIITKATKEVLGQQTNIIFKNKNQETVSALASSSNNSRSNINPEPAVSSPLWHKIRSILKKQYGEAIDKSWFAKLDIEVNAEKKQINIKAPSSFTRDWIKTNYGHAIENAIGQLATEEITEAQESSMQLNSLSGLINMDSRRGLGIGMNIVCAS